MKAIITALAFVVLLSSCGFKLKLSSNDRVVEFQGSFIRSIVTK